MRSVIDRLVATQAPEEALRYAALRNGTMVGLEAAEVFQCVLEVRRHGWD